MEDILNYINGEFVKSESNEYIDVIEPATGETYGRVVDSNQNDVYKAIDAAKNSFLEWSSLTIKKRAEYLNQIADAIEHKIDEFAEYESRDTGKPEKLAKQMDIPRAVSNFRFFAQHAQSFNFESKINNDYSSNSIIHNPLGVVGCISPWNLPLYLFTWKIAPALVAGNTVIAKPSEVTPFTAYNLASICNEINFPKGVLNIIHGKGDVVGSSIIKHSDVKAISFTGGTETGKKIVNDAANSFKKLSLEMGGKNAAIIFDDCNYSEMLDTIVKSSFSNQGQICLCTSRLLIESTIYDKFKSEFIDRVSRIKIGDPKDDKTEFGAISSKEHFDKILKYIEIAKNEGGEILLGGNPIQIKGRCENGYYINPTIIDSLDNTSIINQDEIFGPVVTLQSFDSEEEAINIANDSVYGLSATIWTENIDKADRISSKIEAGVIWINCWLIRDLRTPFGGMKESGMGREGGDYALDFFTETKNICRSK